MKSPLPSVVPIWVGDPVPIATSTGAPVTGTVPFWVVTVPVKLTTCVPSVTTVVLGVTATFVAAATAGTVTSSFPAVYKGVWATVKL